MPETFSNNAIGALSASIGPTDTSLTLNTGQGTLFPTSGNFRILIESELMLVGAISGDTLSSITRGVEGTTAASHAAATQVAHVVTAGALGLFLQALPAGMITPFAGPSSAVPAGWLLCDGSAVSRTTYAALYAVIGNTYGPGDGSTTFNLPDGQGRALYGARSGLALGANDGVAVGSRHASHHHGVSTSTSPSATTSSVGDHQHAAAGGHSHSVGGGTFIATTTGSTTPLGSGGSSRYLINNYYGNTDSVGDHQHAAAGGHSHTVTITVNISTNTSGGGPADAPSYLVVNHIIKT